MWQGQTHFFIQNLTNAFKEGKKKIKTNMRSPLRLAPQDCKHQSEPSLWFCRVGFGAFFFFPFAFLIFFPLPRGLFVCLHHYQQQ